MSERSELVEKWLKYIPPKPPKLWQSGDTITDEEMRMIRKFPASKVTALLGHGVGDPPRFSISFPVECLDCREITMMTALKSVFLRYLAGGEITTRCVLCREKLDRVVGTWTHRKSKNWSEQGFYRMEASL